MISRLAGSMASTVPVTEPGRGPVLYFSSTRGGGFSPEPIDALTGMSAESNTIYLFDVFAGDITGDPRLVAYVVGDRVEPQALRAHLVERLPEPMLPAAYVPLDELPLLPEAVDLSSLNPYSPALDPVNELAFGDGTFDVVISSECIEHTPSPQLACVMSLPLPLGRCAWRLGVLCRIQRCAKPGPS